MSGPPSFRVCDRKECINPHKGVGNVRLAVRIKRSTAVFPHVLPQKMTGSLEHIVRHTYWLIALGSPDHLR